MGSKRRYERSKITIILKVSMKDHITWSFQSLKGKIGAISHMYKSKTSISSKIQKFWSGPLEFSHCIVKYKGRLFFSHQHPNQMNNVGPFHYCVYQWYLSNSLSRDSNKDYMEKLHPEEVDPPTYHFKVHKNFVLS